MTALEDLRARLERIGCRPELVGGELRIMGQTDGLTPELLAEARRMKPALLAGLLREKALALAAFIDGDAPFAERQARLPEYLETVDSLAAAEQQLWACWRRAGFMVLWSALVEEFILVGDGSPPPGSEGYALYTRAEVEALKDRSLEDIAQAHRLKKVFRGTVLPSDLSRQRT